MSEIGIMDCDVSSLSLEDIIRMCTFLDDEGNAYVHFIETEKKIGVDLFPCAECGSALSTLQIFKAALSLDSEGNYCLNMVL
ncbi:unnamed protein product [marine sediment metagenome]|uniref:Uncharacterized protein n=1 Tax=marine sediment metagenome TaxID=412755 RepID=X1BUZ4_9ZZZZ